MTYITRFAPSPTGPLHLGHAYSALLAHDMARAAGGKFVLRIEDIDTTRSRAHWETQIYEDLAWLGIHWDDEPLRQSERLCAYSEALQDLWARGLLFQCTCTRRDIAAAASAPQEGAELVYGPDGLIYPGTCREKPQPATMPKGEALRLNMEKALRSLADLQEFSFAETCHLAFKHSRVERFSARDLIGTVGDIVLSRKDFPGSYHLSVVLDDAAQEITQVVRGEDLFDATRIHVVLQKLLGIETPTYTHHRLIRDESGKRLAKRDDARAIATYRADGASPEDIRKMVGLT